MYLAYFAVIYALITSLIGLYATQQQHGCPLDVLLTSRVCWVVGRVHTARFLNVAGRLHKVSYGNVTHQRYHLES